jgi:hypothetical protein
MAYISFSEGLIYVNYDPEALDIDNKLGNDSTIELASNLMKDILCMFKYNKARYTEEDNPELSGIFYHLSTKDITMYLNGGRTSILLSDTPFTDYDDLNRPVRQEEIFSMIDELLLKSKGV